jgi:hypothetical protein
MVYRPAATADVVRTPPSEREGQILDDRCRSSLHGCRPACLRQLRAWELELRREQGAAAAPPWPLLLQLRARELELRRPVGGHPPVMDLAEPALGFTQPDLAMAAEEQRPTLGWISRQRNSRRGRRWSSPRAPAMVLAPAHQRRSCKAQWPSWPAVAMGRKGEGGRKRGANETFYISLLTRYELDNMIGVPREQLW